MARKPTRPRKTVPRTHAAAKKAGHPPTKNFNLWSRMAEVSRQFGTHVPADDAKPGDKAWEGPCEGSTKVVCYFDEDMQPSRCVNVPC